MKILVVESICGGASWPNEPPPSLRKEGAAMLGALLEDLAMVEDIVLATLLDSRFAIETPSSVKRIPVNSAEHWDACLRRYAEESDAVWLVAPEINGELRRFAEVVIESGTPLLSPGLELIELASDKHATCRWLEERGVPVPRGIRWNEIESTEIQIPFPAIAKPIDGAGSLGVCPMQEPHELRALPTGDWRIEEFCSGQSCSVALLLTRDHPVILGTATQSIAKGTCEYLGGSTPLPGLLAERAVALARKVADCLPDSNGYIGVDLILGEQNDGRDDVVLEVNPRLTTSYLGLRQATETNLAELAVHSFCRKPAVQPLASDCVTFLCDGTITSRNPLAASAKL